MSLIYNSDEEFEGGYYDDEYLIYPTFDDDDFDFEYSDEFFYGEYSDDDENYL